MCKITNKVASFLRKSARERAMEAICIVPGAEGPGILCVSNFHEYSRERERERERETLVTSSISFWNREWICKWLPRPRVDSTHRVLRTPGLSLSLGVPVCLLMPESELQKTDSRKTRGLALERCDREIDCEVERRWRSWNLHSLVSLPLIANVSLACFKQD